MLMPVIIAELLRNRENGGEVEKVKAVARSHLVLTHPDEEMERISDVMVDLTYQLLFRKGIPLLEIYFMRWYYNL
jgi:hypothetical protein